MAPRQLRFEAHDVVIQAGGASPRWVASDKVFWFRWDGRTTVIVVDVDPTFIYNPKLQRQY